MTDTRCTADNDGWAFAKQLSDALLKVRPLGGSELFVKRNGQYYADPDYCGGFIERSHAEFHKTMKRAITAEKNLEMARKALEEIEDLGADGCTAARLGNIAHAALIQIAQLGSKP